MSALQHNQAVWLSSPLFSPVKKNTSQSTVSAVSAVPANPANPASTTRTKSEEGKEEEEHDKACTSLSFEEAQEMAKSLELSDAEKLKLYGWYKQSTVGDVNISRPGMMDLRNKAKWNAWKACQGS